MPESLFSPLQLGALQLPNKAVDLTAFYRALDWWMRIVSHLTLIEGMENHWPTALAEQFY